MHFNFKDDVYISHKKKHSMGISHGAVAQSVEPPSKVPVWCNSTVASSHTAVNPSSAISSSAEIRALFWENKL